MTEIEPLFIDKNTPVLPCTEESEKDLVISQLNSNIAKQDVIINFLKKELQKKTYCQQVMKRQYREMKAKLYSVSTLAKHRGESYLDTLKTLNLYKEFVEHYDAAKMFEAFKEMKQIGEEK